MISVITATHNRPEMLKRAIESVLNQSYTDFEYIIVDDNSTPETKAVVDSFNDARIVYIRYDGENPAKTHCKPLNAGILASKGEYICYLDDDNEYYPFHLDVLRQAFDISPDLDVAYCDMMVQLPNGTSAMGIAMEFDAQFLLRRNFIDTSEAMHKRQAIFDIGGWNEKVKRFTDWNVWCRMAKWGKKFQRVPIVALKYYDHGGDTQSKRTDVRIWTDQATGMAMFEPPFDPVGDYIFENYLGYNLAETRPKVAIFTLTYGRLDYTKRMWESLNASTEYPFDWVVFEQGSEDGTAEWIADKATKTYLSEKNVGITKGSNECLEMVGKDYQIVIKADNDCEFMTKRWLETLIDLWMRNHMLYMSPHPEGLVNNPGGAPRVGYSNIGPYFVEVTKHIGGLCAFIDAKAYDSFRWIDQFKHGNQDMEASIKFRELGYMPCYIPMHRVMHMDGTSAQQTKYPDYFARRITEKTEVA